MLTREQTHDSLELQKARAHDAFERLNQSLQTLILHKRELQLEGVDEAYQKRSTGDIESRLIKCEGRLARALRLYHQVQKPVSKQVRNTFETCWKAVQPVLSNGFERTDGRSYASLQ
jgi:hypothetical protein